MNKSITTILLISWVILGFITVVWINSSNQHSILPSSSETQLPSTKMAERHGMAVAVQGKSSQLRKWVSFMIEIPFSERPHLFLGYFDSAEDTTQLCNGTIQQENGERKKTEWCTTVSLFNTSWTRGRNMQSVAIWKEERKRGAEFEYWVFTDNELQ